MKKATGVLTSPGRAQGRSNSILTREAQSGFGFWTLGFSHHEVNRLREKMRMKASSYSESGDQERIRFRTQEKSH